MIQDFMEHVQGIARLLSSDGLPYGWMTEVGDVDIDELLAHLRCTSGMPWEDEIIVKWWAWLGDYCEQQNAEASEGYRVRLNDLRIGPLLYQFFGIDQEKIEAERREILAACRAGNALAEARDELGLKD